MKTQTVKTRVSIYAIPGLGLAEPVLRARKTNPTALEIKKIVAHYYDLPLFNLDLRTRKRQIAEPRQIAHYFSRKYTRESLSSIGKMIGGVDHATVLHSERTVQNLIDTDKRFGSIIKDISQLIRKFINERK
jgi:chromosomal replication initiator protein